MYPASAYRRLADGAPTDHPLHVGWSDHDAQRVRLEVALDCAYPAGRPLHDAGCGTGALLDLMRERRISVPDYVGTDASRWYISAARKRHPAEDFRALDLEDEEPPRADVTIASGLLAFYRETAALRLVRRLWEATAEALVFNALAEVSPADARLGLLPLEPETVLRFCRGLTPFVVVRTDYLRGCDATYLLRRA